MGDRDGHELLTETLRDVLNTAESLLGSQAKSTWYAMYVLPEEEYFESGEYEDGVPPPPRRYYDRQDEGGDGGSHHGHGAADVAKAIGLFSALARGDFDL